MSWEQGRDALLLGICPTDDLLSLEENGKNA